MSRLIDADLLKECYAGTNALDGKADYMSIRKMIDNQPTAYDEKQMPKKLVSIRKIKEFDGYDMGNCPACGEPLDNSFYENLKYCFVCGQAIDWGEEE